jgi:DnaJ-class molecular chaperone
MQKPRDYYQVLGVSRTATADEIRKAYRRLARKYHPDVNDSPDAAKRFAEATEAYDVLSDPEKRKTYDRFGHAGVGAGAGAGPYGAGAWPGGGFGGHGRGAGPFTAADMGSIFEELFGARGPSPFDTARSQAPRPRRGQDLRHTLTVTFMTAAQGGTERLRLANPEGGTQTVTVKVPAGIESGAKLRVKGKGQPGPEGGPTGDLILTVEVGAHPLFRREGLDLLVNVPITLAEAGLGATVAVPLLTGSATVKIPAGASSGRKLRLAGRGITDDKGRKGDFYAVIQIVAPERPSPRAEQLLGELADELQNPRESGPWARLKETGEAT